MKELTTGTYPIIGRQKQTEVETWLRRHGIALHDCYRYAEIEPGRFAIYTYQRDADGRLAFLDGEPVRRETLVVDEWPPPFYPEDAA
jgi:hypothetical protein